VLLLSLTRVRCGRQLTFCGSDLRCSQVDPRRSQEAMKDPEIQRILKDPIINEVLHNLSTDPRSAQK
jgi:hypothetical protein